MISTHTTTQAIPQTPEVYVAETRATETRRARPFKALAGLVLALACLGASWFAYQSELAPQPKDFQPAWHDAQWIGASDGNATTAYYRYATTLEVATDNAFVTIAASQVFSFYVNGVLIGSNSTDFANYPRSYIYEVTPSLVLGVNVFAIRVDNLDGQAPLLRASFGTVIGGIVTYYGTGDGAGANWMATTQTTQVYPQDTSIIVAATAWTGRTFNAASWLPAQPVTSSTQSMLTSQSPSLSVNPQLYEQPVAAHWVSTGVGQDGYFVRQVSLPQGTSMSWLRIAATGTANVFINGSLIFTWNYHRTSFSQITVNKLTGKTKVRHIPELVLGVYDVSPFLHAGVNTVAIHISLQNVPGLRNIQVTEAPALSMDVLAGDGQGDFTWIGSPDGWQASHQQAPAWINGGAAVHDWTSPTFTGRPDGYSIVYVSRSSELTRGQQAVQSVPVEQAIMVILLSIAAVLGLWLLVSLTIARRFVHSASTALELMSLAYLPALAGEGLLIVISKEPQVAQPFPYTTLWGLMLLAGVAAGYLLISLSVGLRRATGRPHDERDALEGRPQGYAPIGVNLTTKSVILSAAKDLTRRGPRSFAALRMTFDDPSRNTIAQEGQLKLTLMGYAPRVQRPLDWLKRHWPIVVLLVATMPLVFYDLGYEAYWQDELVSYLVAKSILYNGLPMLPSGFLYPKGELYSYLLALFMSIFGDQGGGPRVISGVEYLLTLALVYYVGCRFFDRRVALVAALMLAFSPHELIWARQMRMYQQAQLLTLLTTYLFYRAVQERHRVSLVYLATGVLLVTYLSHEETFIILPALVLCLLVVGYIVKEERHRLPWFFYQKHWWIAASIAVGVIGTQLLITKVTHPPVLGTDTTVRPMIQLTTNNIPYYLNMLFTPTSNDPSNSTLVSNIPSSIMLDSCLMLLGCILAMKSNRLALRFTALFFVVSFLTLVFVLTMQADRYFYPLAPFYYLLAAFAFVKIARLVWVFAKTRLASPNSRPSASIIKWLVGLSAALALVSVLLAPMFPLNNYNLYVSRLFNLPYYHHFGDYDEAGLYIRQHMRQGDIVISIIPDSIVMFYAGQSDYFFSVNHALFLFEQDSHIVDTYSGKVALLRQSDLDAVLDMHARVWLFSANNHYQNEVLKHFILPSDFHVVYSGADSIV
ncbi:MAG TPA: glycosyltransferase family 39 protein, partial [Ktedonobacteraceae bacterium]|nr:glycosyltransferase family 39 protein [Ktedonobacteraceae bacterium]